MSCTVGPDPCVCDLCRERGRPERESTLRDVYTSLHHCEHDVNRVECSHELCMLGDDDHIKGCPGLLHGGGSGDASFDSHVDLYFQSRLSLSYNVPIDIFSAAGSFKACRYEELDEASMATNGTFLSP